MSNESIENAIKIIGNDVATSLTNIREKINNSSDVELQIFREKEEEIYHILQCVRTINEYYGG